MIIHSRDSCSIVVSTVSKFGGMKSVKLNE